ncbi:hypothetical protein FHX64_000416 [Microbacter margulisiae]|uniref:Uncharacterized protein n=1 Tax=Microbacter margulisiae TaxID=1350067 RepID=A0A7W5DQ49_9PORP|nr:hypothetical protein [Microbacter margulisiae]
MSQQQVKSGIGLMSKAGGLKTNNKQQVESQSVMGILGVVSTACFEVAIFSSSRNFL